MHSSSKNLWGSLPKDVEVRTPFIILKEQAAILSEMTNGLLIGEVKRQQGREQSFSMTFRIRVPALSYYTYSILTVTYPPELYPVRVQDLTGSDESYECKSEEDFEKCLGFILSSEPVLRVISTLLADVRASDTSAEI